MTEGETRLVAWRNELRRAHDALRDALQLARETATTGNAEVTRDLLLYCQGFCVALGPHHGGEDLESHFRFEEREILGVLATLDGDADPTAVFGPL